LACLSCGLNGYAADEALGLDGYLSPRALRLACLAASDVSFASAAEYLGEFCGVAVAPETLRLACQRRGQQAADWQAQAAEVEAAFARAAGEMELQLDAGKVNTQDGWRDLKVASFAQRPLGKPAGTDAWDSRVLPAPTARLMVAALESIAVFQKRLRPEAARLGLGDPAAVHVRGDGAEWIWNAVDSHFPGCRQTLDVYHGSEHLGTASKQLYGEGTTAAAERFAAGQAKLLERGWPGACDFVAEELRRGDTAQRRAVLEDLLGYFAKHVGRLGYAERLREGRAIGSGLIEGGMKTLGQRLKARGRGGVRGT
jgi:hypothetical protein